MINGHWLDAIGGRKGLLIGCIGCAASCVCMGLVAGRPVPSLAALLLLRYLGTPWTFGDARAATAGDAPTLGDRMQRIERYQELSLPLLRNISLLAERLEQVEAAINEMSSAVIALDADLCGERWVLI